MSLLHKNLQAFQAIALHQSVQGAAKSLFLTQTAVTQRLKLLEQELNVSLFERSRRGMLLTREGEILLRYCEVNQGLADSALEKIRGSGINTPVRLSICGPSSDMSTRVASGLIPVMKKFPQLLMEFIYCDDESPAEWLREGKVQLAIVSKKQVTKEMQVKVLKPETYVLAASSKWEGRRLKEIIEKERIIDFNPSDDMTFDYLKYYDLEGMQQERHFVNNPETIAQFLSNGLGYSVLEKSLAESYVKSKKICLLNDGKVFTKEIFLVWYERPVMTHYFSATIDAID
jgi:DNA-binding transcriptional LysR family regulator